MTTVRPELGLERLLLALERDLLDMADREIVEAANEIGMNPIQKGSAALFGVLFTMKPTAKRPRSAEKTVRPAETNPRTRPKRSAGSITGSRPRRRSKRGTPPAE